MENWEISVFKRDNLIIHCDSKRILIQLLKGTCVVCYIWIFNQMYCPRKRN